MNVQLIRNATLVVNYAGKRFLIDPMLAEQGTYPPFSNALRQDKNNPLVDLPVPIDDVIDVDAVIVTHLHLDHFDDVAKDSLPKDLKLFVQNENDAEVVKKYGFQHVEVLGDESVFDGIRLTKTNGEHGRGEIVKRMGEVCGVVFQHPNEKTLYVAGDTVWNEDVKIVIDTYNPGVIVVNGGGNQFFEGGPLIMGKEDIVEVAKAAPDATILSVHMEAVNHWTLSRNELKRFTQEQGIASQVLIPEDGETCSF